MRLQATPPCASPPRDLRVRRLWQLMRAAARVLILFRRRRLATRGDVEAATAVTPIQTPKRPKAPAPPTAASLAEGYTPLGDGGYAQRLDRFRRVLSKPLHARSDVDIKLIADFLVNAQFAPGLPSPSFDELARSTRFHTFHDGEVLFRQGDGITDTSARYLVVRGSLLVFRSAQYAKEASEGEDYELWLKRLSSSTSAVRYGDCMNTCGAGDTCGDDAFKGSIFRTTTVISQSATVVASVTQADFNRVTRFRVDDTAVLAGRLLGECFPVGKPASADSGGPKRVGCPQSSGPATSRTWLRFLSAFECFRGFSGRFQLALASKFECRVLESDQTSEPIVLGLGTALLIVLRSQVCVHQTATNEDAMLLKVESENSGSNLRSTKQGAKRGTAPRGSLPHTVNGVQACGSSNHTCSLYAGSSFGETAILFENGGALAGVELFVCPSTPFSPSDSVAVLLLSHEALASVRAQYLASLDFAPRTAHTILSRIHPRDRMGEQLTFLMEFLRRVSPSRVFFQQLPVRVLFETCLHASMETFDVSSGGEMECIQKEGSAVDHLRVILNGYVAVFKSTRSTSEGEDEVGLSVSVEATRELLKREQSRLIRGVNSDQNPPRQRRYLDKSGTVDPVGILPCGACFGQLQLFTGSTSPYTSAAYSAGHASTSSLHVLTLPGRIARLCLAGVDDLLVYNPVRVLRRIVKAKATTDRGHSQLEQQLSGLNFERLLLSQAALAGLPRCRLTASMPGIRVLDVPAKHFIYETGESSRGVLYVLLSGSARLFCFSGHQTSPSHSTDSRRALPQKFSAKVSALMRLKAVGGVENSGIDCDSSTEEGEALTDETSFVFNRRVDDAFFSQSYSRSEELAVGDGFGCCGELDADPTAVQSLSLMARKTSTSVLNGLPTSFSTVYQDTAVAMTDCKVGVLFSDLASSNSRYRLSALEKTRLRSWFQRDGHPQSVDCSEGRASAPPVLPDSVLELGLRALEQADLAGKLSSSQRFELVKKMKFCSIQNGERVFQAGEEGRVVYLIVSGRVRIYGGVDDEHSTTGTQGATRPAGTWSMLLGEGDTFGEEALVYGGSGCTRSVTAVVEAMQTDNATGAELLYLTRDSLEEASTRQDASTSWSSNDPSGVASPDRLFGFYKVSPLARWKRAVHHIIRQRTMRSQWSSVLCQAKQRRAELVWNLVRDFEGWKDTQPDAALRLCAHATLTVLGHGVAVYSKDDEAVESVYVVVSGSVAIQQPTTVTSTGQPLLIASGPLTPVQATTRVVVRVVKQESCFGEFEVLAKSARRAASAIVSTTEARVLSIAKDAFLELWPHRSLMETKLQLLQRALLPILPLDDAQLCCVYYTVRERTFQREQVVSSAAVPPSTLFQVVASGTCVVHDSVSLQPKKQTQSRSPRRPATLSLDTRLATLGPGAILLAPETRNDASSPSETRRGSRKEANALGEVGEPPNELMLSPTEYVVADSPLVTTLTLELPPVRRYLTDLMLGRHGLNIVRSAVAAHQKWRGSIGAEASLRLAVTSVTKSSVVVAPSPVRTRMGVGNAPQSLFPSLSPAKPRMDLVQFLQGRELMKNLDLSSPHGRDASRAVTAVESPRAVSFPCLQPNRSPSCPPSGSFATFSGSSSRVLARVPESVWPSENLAGQDKKHYESRAVVTSQREQEQLRKEQTTVALLSRHSLHLNRYSQAGDERDKRHRHGRPPPKEVTTRTHFADVFPAYPPRVELRSDHDRKKSALVRRLLHAKPAT